MNYLFDCIFHNRFNQDMRKTSQVSIGTKHIFNVRVVPVLKDNYSYILFKPSSPSNNNSNTTSATAPPPPPRKLALIDVSSDYEPVLRECKEILQGAELNSSNIELWGTHKHWDHVGGFEAMVSKFGGGEDDSKPMMRVVGGEHEPVPRKNEMAKEGTQLKFDEDLVVDSYHVPFHTRGHVLFHFYHPEERDTAGGAVFSGDAIFVGGGVGACFDGKTSEVIGCFTKAASKLPKAAQIFCGHNYMKNFIGYACSLQPNNAEAKKMQAKCEEQNAQGVPTVPTTLAQELSISPFFKAAVGDKEFLENVVPEKERSDPEKAMEWVYNNCP